MSITHFDGDDARSDRIAAQREAREQRRHAAQSFTPVDELPRVAGQPAEIASIVREFGVRIDTPVFHNADKFSCVWRFPQVDTSDHPTAKPVGLMARMVKTTTDHGDIVLDPFAGSGTTLVAAANENRRAIGVEREERYCELIAKRLSNQTMALDFGDAS